MNIVDIKQVKKSYGDLEVLKGIDLSIAKGEIVAIVGPSGAGKTTLLQIMGTLDAPTMGAVFINNERVDSYSDKKLSRFRNNNIGFVFQFHHLFPEFTAFENVCIPGYIAKTKSKEVEARAKNLLENLGLKNRINHKPGELSGGEQQRVAICRALINSPEIVLADEPSGNLDSQNAKELHELFFQLRDTFGQTFVIVTHNTQLAEMADRTIRMSDGIISN